MWKDLREDLKKLYCLVSASIVKNPPAEIRESFSRQVIEFWKRFHEFPDDLIDKKYLNSIPIGY